MKNITFIREWRETRGDESAYLINFVCNFARAARLMHKTLGTFKDQKDVMQEAIRAYVISITSCLETFYRDLYSFILSLDETTLERILPDIKEKATYSDMHSALKDGVKFSEIATAEASFQSLAEIEFFMSKLFFPNSYLEVLGSFIFKCVIPTRSRKSNVQLHDGWRSEFAAIFNHRHSLVHNSNKPCQIDFKEIQKFEALALLVPQLTTALVATKMNTQHGTDSKGMPALLLVEDVIADDWETADETNAIQDTK